jgi:hypothetical protein
LFPRIDNPHLISLRKRAGESDSSFMEGWYLK